MSVSDDYMWLWGDTCPTAEGVQAKRGESGGVSLSCQCKSLPCAPHGLLYNWKAVSRCQMWWLAWCEFKFRPCIDPMSCYVFAVAVLVTGLKIQQYCHRKGNSKNNDLG